MNLQSLIAVEILKELKAFLEVDERFLFEDDLFPLRQAISGEAVSHKRVDGHLIEDKRAPSFMFITDSALVAELGTFLDDLEHWLFRIGEIRGQWFYDHIANELPENYLSVFGCSSPLVLRLSRIKKRGQRIYELLTRMFPNDFDARKEKAIQLWNDDPNITWRKVAEAIDHQMEHDQSSVDAFKKEIARYAKNRITLRKGKAGLKKKT